MKRTLYTAAGSIAAHNAAPAKIGASQPRARPIVAMVAYMSWAVVLPKG